MVFGGDDDPPISFKTFMQRFIECLKHYRKLMMECADDKDVAHYFKEDLKKFILDHKEEFSLISTINCERNFLKFIQSYFYKKQGTSNGT